MPANKFVLRHRHIEVDYTIGVTPGLIALTYNDGNNVKSFTSAQIQTDATALGSMVSIPLLSSTDTGGERFGFFLPQLDVPSGETANFNAAGIYGKFAGPDSIPHISPSWSCMEMHGTAETVMVPLAHPPLNKIRVVTSRPARSPQRKLGRVRRVLKGGKFWADVEGGGRGTGKTFCPRGERHKAVAPDVNPVFKDDHAIQ